MKHRYLVLATIVLSALSYASVASAAPRPTTKTPVGVDVSYPQCGKRLPSGQAFGIVGVNGGNAATYNPCLADQLVWAKKSTGATTHPKIQLYLNTANPGQSISTITTWPLAATVTNPYGPCDGTNTLACSWQYGYNRAEAAAAYFASKVAKANISSAVTDYTWWLDVEYSNTWQESNAIDAGPNSTEYQTLNAASLEGMTAHLTERGGKVGLYASPRDWSFIVGARTGITNNLAGLDSWNAAALTQAGAIERCATQAPFTMGGRVALTQYVAGGIDYNYSCS